MQQSQAQRRRQARRKALQALYQWEFTGDAVSDIDAQFLAGTGMGKADLEYFRELFGRIVQSRADTDASLAPFLDRRLEQLDPIERNVLRIGAYELRECPDVPFRVVINEAVELAKLFGAEQGHKYVNGVLDALARQLRARECTADS